MDPELGNNDDLNNQNIMLNPTDSKIPPIPQVEIPKMSPAAEPNKPQVGFFEEQKQKVAGSLFESATEKVTEGCLSRCAACFNCVNILKPYFQVNNVEIFDRLKSSITPLNKTFYETASKNPDLYGPFWISNTLVFIIAAIGTLNKYFGVILLIY